MTKHLIVVENIEDWSPYFPSEQVIGVDDYLQSPSQRSDSRAQILNLCRSLEYLSRGYYCSMVAEARGHRVLPGLRNMSSQLDKQLASTEQSASFVLTISFGQTPIASLQKLARQIFEHFPCPILEVEFSFKGHWIISQIKAGAINKLTEQEQDFFAEALDSFSHRLWRKPSKRRQFRYDMAILHNPKEAMPPSNMAALKKFISSGRRIGIDVELITPREYIRLAEYDALFIRETTATHNHTYKFSRRAESEGLVVIDDPTSIIRCTNKIFLKELLAAHDLPLSQRSSRTR